MRGRTMEKPKSQKKGEFYEMVQNFSLIKSNQSKEENYEKDIEEKDFEDLLFNLSSEELIRLPYFSIAK